MKEQLISFQTAKLAKEKGFDQNPYKIKESYCPTYMDGSEITIKNSLFSPENNIATVPTQSLLQKWLREKYNIDIIVKPWTGDIKGTKTYAADIMIFGAGIYIKTARVGSYEEALEEGLKEALKLIK